MACPIKSSSPMVMMLAVTSFMVESLYFSAMYNRMKRAFFLLTVVCLSSNIYAQDASVNLGKAWSTFEADSQLKSATASIYVIDETTGEVVFDKNSRIGLAPASTQKIMTAAAAYELLRKDFRFETK